MELPRNGFKRALAAGRTQIGLWSSLSSNYSVEVIIRDGAKPIYTASVTAGG